MIRQLIDAIKAAWQFERVSRVMRTEIERIQPFPPKLRPGFELPVHLPPPPERDRMRCVPLPIEPKP